MGRRLTRDRDDGYVYLVQVGHADGPVKIGYAADPAARCRQFQTAHAEEVRLLGVIPGLASLEKELHEWYAGHRLRGEWFRPSAALWAEFGLEWRASRRGVATNPEAIGDIIGTLQLWTLDGARAFLAQDRAVGT